MCNSWLGVCVCVCVCVWYVYTNIYIYIYLFIYIPNSTSVFKNRDFPYAVVAWSHILMPMFPPIMTRFDHSGWDHVAGHSVSPTLLLLCRSLSAQTSWLEAVLQSVHVVYLMRPKIVCLSLQMALPVLYAFDVTLYFYYPFRVSSLNRTRGLIFKSNPMFVTLYAEV